MDLKCAAIADVFVVLTKSEAHGGKIRDFMLDRAIPGLSAPKIGGKLSLRASFTGEIVMDGVELGLTGALLVGRLLDEGSAAPTMISLVRRHICGKTLDVARASLVVHGATRSPGSSRPCARWPTLRP